VEIGAVVVDAEVGDLAVVVLVTVLATTGRCVVRVVLAGCRLVVIALAVVGLDVVTVTALDVVDFDGPGAGDVCLAVVVLGAAVLVVAGPGVCIDGAVEVTGRTV
jgi:hypothetical protein